MGGDREYAKISRNSGRRFCNERERSRDHRKSPKVNFEPAKDERKNGTTKKKDVRCYNETPKRARGKKSRGRSGYDGKEAQFSVERKKLAILVGTEKKLSSVGLARVLPNRAGTEREADQQGKRRSQRGKKDMLIVVQWDGPCRADKKAKAQGRPKRGKGGILFQSKKTKR